jgi:hypothetical protein
MQYFFGLGTEGEELLFNAIVEVLLIDYTADTQLTGKF